MQIGDYTIELLSEGRFELFKDGHINRTSKEENSSSDIDSSTTTDPMVVGINPVLIQDGVHNIIVDPGLGWGMDAGSTYADISNIFTNLAIFELKLEDITHVIFSHLHYDHIAGCTYTNDEHYTKPTFPNASYYVHQKEWDHALAVKDDYESYYGANYQLDEFYRLIADDYVKFLDGTYTQLLDGIKLIHTGGHTPGHQIVQVDSQNEKAYFTGDLLPSSSQLNHHVMGLRDEQPSIAKKEKVRLLRKACDEQAVLLFYHSTYGRAGRLVQDKEDRYILTDIFKQ